ncbi:MAG: hypothetical protein ACETWM_00755 [Candidatus Lokiarchaeia archaeon]
MENTTGKTEENKKTTFNPLNLDDCFRALTTNYTSNAGECQFYTDSAESKCLLDPYSRRTWNCKGRCFVNGYRCDYISDVFSSRNSAEEINSLISLIGQEGTNIIGNLGWSIMTQEEVSAVSGIKKEEIPFKLRVLKLLELVSEKDGKLRLTDLGRIVHDYLLVQKYLI